MRRRKAREFAVQLLFAAETQEESPARLAEFRADHLIRQYMQNFGSTVPAELIDDAYLLRILQGTLSAIQELDTKIEKYSDNWRTDRMTRLDRNVLRLGTFELLHINDTPPNVVINEAVELAKKFGTEDSGAFINGILDKIRVTL